MPAFRSTHSENDDGGHSRSKNGVPMPTITADAETRAYRFPSTWVQMAIIPTNSDSEASAAAS
jgi:hypothetical protein